MAVPAKYWWHRDMDATITGSLCRETIGYRRLEILHMVTNVGLWWFFAIDLDKPQKGPVAQIFDVLRC